MKKAKKTIRKVAHKVKRTVSRKTYPTHIHGLEHEFIIIVGGGFLVIVFGIMLFFR